MRVLVIHAHPVETSFNAALFGCVAEGLATAGHEVDRLDLYAEGFDPVLSRAERLAYFDETANRARVGALADRVQSAEGIVFVFPTWCLGPPAILKGFFDRVMVPGVSFRLDPEGRLHPNLRHIRRVAAVVTYGRERPILWWFGDPPRKMITRYFRWFVAPGAKIRFLGHYGMHRPNAARETRFLERVRRAMSRF